MGKKCQNRPFLIILPLNFRTLKIVPGRWKFLCRWARYRYPAGQKTQVCRMNGLDRATLRVKGCYRHFKHFFSVLQLLTHIYIWCYHNGTKMITDDRLNILTCQSLRRRRQATIVCPLRSIYNSGISHKAQSCTILCTITQLAHDLIVCACIKC